METYGLETRLTIDRMQEKTTVSYMDIVLVRVEIAEAIEGCWQLVGQPINADSEKKSKKDYLNEQNKTEWGGERP